MSGKADDWKKEMRKASKAATERADALADDQLQAIAGQSARLKKIVTNLELTDDATHQKLVGIVNDATRGNESLGSVIERIRELGGAAGEVVSVVESLDPAKALSVLRDSLDR